MAGHYSTLLHHLSKNTCLLIGLSLQDNTLKHLLRQSASINPGHFHYYIAYTSESSVLSEDQKNAIFESNFELYNLVTLFLNNNEIKDVGVLLTMPTNQFKTAAKLSDDAALKFVYYITGSVGSGKTTVLQYFRNLATFSEWPEPKNELLAIPFDQLSEQQTNEIDTWISQMFFVKNTNLL